jgi:hypothetical protein
LSSEELFDEFEKLRAERWKQAVDRTNVNELLADIANEVTLLYMFINEKHEPKPQGFKDF